MVLLRYIQFDLNLRVTDVNYVKVRQNKEAITNKAYNIVVSNQALSN